MLLAKIDTPYLLAIIGGGVLILGLIVYFSTDQKGKTPAIVSCTVAALALGCGLGALGYEMFSSPRKDKGGGAGPRDMPMFPPPGMGGDENNPESRLVSLVRRLDHLVGKPVALSLTQEEKKQIADELDGLQEAPSLPGEEVQARLDRLLEILKPHKEKLLAAGFQWPGEKDNAENLENPFEDEDNGKALKALQSWLKTGSQ